MKTLVFILSIIPLLYGCSTSSNNYYMQEVLRIKEDPGILVKNWKSSGFSAYVNTNKAIVWYSLSF